VLPILVSSETTLALWVDLAPVFQFWSVEFMSGMFLPPKMSEGTLVERFDLDLTYLSFGSTGLFMKVNKNKKEQLPLGLGEPTIANAQVLTSRLKVPPPPN
jgi:hypothetical protein